MFPCHNLAFCLAATLLFQVAAMAATNNPPGGLKLSRAFTHNAILQRGRSCPVFGRDLPGTKINVSFAGQKLNALAAADGHWRVDLAPLSVSSQPQALIAVGSSTLTLTNLLVGDVWLVSGQSNADWPLRLATDGAVFIASATNHLIRYLQMAESPTTTGAAWNPAQVARLNPEHYFTGLWQMDDSSTAGAVSAIGYFFARQLATNLNVPIGLIDCTVGGTPTESWIPTETLQANPRLAAMTRDFLTSPMVGAFVKARLLQNLADWDHAGRPAPMPEHPYTPGACWRFGLADVAPFGIRGLLWYQGESNADFSDPAEFDAMAAWHTDAFTTLVAGWRKAWERDDLPVYVVQLPQMNRPSWPWFRESQSRCALTISNTALVVAYDLGDPNDVHPTNKRPVAERLALIARALSYGEKTEWSGPLLRSWRVEGKSVVLEFDHTSGGLVAFDGPPLRHFEIAGADRRFFPAEAIISGERVRVSAPEVPAPVAVRYAWSLAASLNFFNTAGLPTSPFRTDDWPAKSSPSKL